MTQLNNFLFSLNLFYIGDVIVEEMLPNCLNLLNEISDFSSWSCKHLHIIKGFNISL